MRRRLLPLIALAALFAAAAPATAGGLPGYLAAPTDQLAVPGALAGAEITPEGDLYTGSVELAYAFGPRLGRWRAPRRHLADGRYPVLDSSATSGGVSYRLTELAADVDGRPVAFLRVDMRNRSRRRATARWAVSASWSDGAPEGHGRYRYRFPRPATPAQPGLYDQPGEPFEPRPAMAAGDGAVTRDGRVLYAFSPAPPGGRMTTTVRPASAGPARPSTALARTAYGVALAPGHGAAAELRVPLVPQAMSAAQLADLRAGSFAAHRAAVLGSWRSALSGALGLSLPEPAVTDAFYASLVHILEPRYQLADGRWVQAVNELQYHAFWLRDTAIISQALDLAGLHAQAGQDLGFFGAWQQPDGLFESRPGQLDGEGEALWALGEHVRRTGDAAFAAAWLPAVERSMGWLEQATAHDPLGLVPPSNPHDDELVAGHLAGDDFWAVAGADAAAGLAQAAGRPDLAARWRADRDTLRAATVRAVRAAAGRDRGVIPPALDVRGGRDWGNLWAAYPYPVLAPGDRAVTATLRHVRRRFAEGIATYGKALHGYLGFRVFETELERGDQRDVVDGLYASLAHLTATDGCFETGTRPWGKRLVTDDLAPHAWCAAEIVALLRNMLVRERGAGVQLLAAPSPDWLRPGRRLAVRGAPTLRGPVSLALRAVRGGAVLTWSASVPGGTPLWWTVPADARAVRVDGRAVRGPLVALPGPSGRLTVRWRLIRDRRSLALAVSRLAGGYRRRGLRPPS